MCVWPWSYLLCVEQESQILFFYEGRPHDINRFVEKFAQWKVGECGGQVPTLSKLIRPLSQ